MTVKKSKKTAKKTVKKPVTKSPVQEIKVAPVVDSTGVVTMRSVDEPSKTASNQGTVVKPTLDKETGVITMVPIQDTK